MNAKKWMEKRKYCVNSFPATHRRVAGTGFRRTGQAVGVRSSKRSISLLYLFPGVSRIWGIPRKTS